MTIIDEAADQSEGSGGGMSVAEFCKWAGIGRTLAYDEIKAGRLPAKKCRSRTIITRGDARHWLNQLPNKSR
jgi:hypothetical protein